MQSSSVTDTLGYFQSQQLKWQPYSDLLHPHPGPSNRVKSSGIVLADHFPFSKVILKNIKQVKWVALSLMSLTQYNSRQTVNKFNTEVAVSVWKILFFEHKASNLSQQKEKRATEMVRNTINKLFRSVCIYFLGEIYFNLFLHNLNAKVCVVCK